MMQFKPYKFQEEDGLWIPHHPKHCLFYDRGLGKTVVRTKANIDGGVGTHVVVCGSSAMGQWEKHTQWMWPELKPGYDHDIFLLDDIYYVRQNIWNELLHPERTRQHRQFIINYACWLRDLKAGFLTPKHLQHIDQLTFDEAHRGFRGRKSAKPNAIFKHSLPILKKLTHFDFLTGTPIGKGAQEFWPYLHCFNPYYFRSFWRFVGTFCETVEGPWGKEIVGTRPNAEEAFFQLLNQHGRVRTKNNPEIAAQLPAKTRVPIFVYMDKDQERMYREMDATKIAIDSNGLPIVAANSMEETMRLRQMLVCPKILDPNASLGGAFNDLLDQLRESDPADRHTVVFTPFKRAFPHFREALQAKGYHVQELSGGVSTKERDERIAWWRATRGVMLCTIPYAESFDLDPREPDDAKTCWFVGYEWDQQQNLQAEDRMHRLETRYPITCNYYRYSNTVDDQMCWNVNFRSQNVNYIMTTAEQRQ
jgi:SNF2 family DNA or RNA helicase